MKRPGRFSTLSCCLSLSASSALTVYSLFLAYMWMMLCTSLVRAGLCLYIVHSPYDCTGCDTKVIFDTLFIV